MSTASDENEQKQLNISEQKGAEHATQNPDLTVSGAEQRVVQRTTLIIAMFAGFIFPFTGSSTNIAVPIIGQEFTVAATHLSWIVSALMLSSITLNVPFGRLGDLLGKRKIFNLGIFIFFVASLLIAFTPNFAYLIVMRVLQGVGAAMLVATNVAILIDVYPPNKRGSVLGLSVMATYMGLATGPIISGFIIEYWGWRAVFSITALFTLVVLIIALVSSSKLQAAEKARQIQKAHQAQQAQSGGGKGAESGSGRGGSKINIVNTIIYMLAILSSMYGLTTFSQNVFSYLCLGAGVLLFVAFAIHASKIDRPVIAIRLFRHNLGYVTSNIVALLQYAATFALGYIMSIYLQVVKGYPADICGLILIAQPLMMAIISPIVGRLSDRWSPYKIASIGMALCAAAMLSLLFVDENASLLHIIINLLVVGIGFGIFSSPNTNAVLSSVKPQDFGLANSILGTMRSSGQLISMAIITIVTHITIGDQLIEAAGTAGVMSTFRVAFTVFGIICVVGLVLSMLRTRSGGVRKDEAKGAGRGAGGGVRKDSTKD